MDQRLITEKVPAAPSLRFLFRLTSTLAAPIPIGDNGQGTRKIVPLTGGRLESKVGDLQGVEAFEGAQCLDSGADYFTMDTRGVTRLDARYAFRLKSGCAQNRLLVSMHGKSLHKLLRRLKLILESDDPQPAIQESCAKIVIASAVRGETSIVYDAYMLE